MKQGPAPKEVRRDHTYIRHDRNENNRIVSACSLVKVASMSLSIQSSCSRIHMGFFLTTFGDAFSVMSRCFYVA